MKREFITHCCTIKCLYKATCSSKRVKTPKPQICNLPSFSLERKTHSRELQFCSSKTHAMSHLREGQIKTSSEDTFVCLHRTGRGRYSYVSKCLPHEHTTVSTECYTPSCLAYKRLAPKSVRALKPHRPWDGETSLSGTHPKSLPKHVRLLCSVKERSQEYYIKKPTELIKQTKRGNVFFLCIHSWC